MMGNKKVTKREYSHFCFFPGLRTGVIISSALWMIEGIVLSTLFLSYRGTSIYNYIAVLPAILSTYFIILSIISAFGLISLIVYKSTPFLRIYLYISWFFAVFVNSVLAIVTILAVNFSKSYYCGIQSDPCYVNYDLLWLGVILFLQCSLHFYFSIILRVYVNQRAKVTRLISSVSSEYSIKVDKTFDVRGQIV